MHCYLETYFKSFISKCNVTPCKDLPYDLFCPEKCCSSTLCMFSDCWFLTISLIHWHILRCCLPMYQPIFDSLCFFLSKSWCLPYLSHFLVVFLSFLQFCIDQLIQYRSNSNFQFPWSQQTFSILIYTVFFVANVFVFDFIKFRTITIIC